MSASEKAAVVSAPPASHELWRNADRAALLALRCCAGGSSRSAEGCVRAAALDVVVTLVDRNAWSLPVHGHARDDWRPRDCLATDLLAGSLLAEAIGGDETARIAITHLRRQRGLDDFDWPRHVPASEPDDLANGDEASDLAVLSR